jgi:RNA polymerase sigma-70 factor (ECF subfamily)
MYARIWNTDFTTIQNPATYLYVALRNLLLSHMRDSKIIPLERMGEIEYLRVPIDELGPERRVAARQELEHLSHAIESLPSQCRRVFELRKLQDLSQKEVARELGISERTVEKHLAKALSRITKASVRERGTDAHPNRSGVETDGTRTERD